MKQISHISFLCISLIFFSACKHNKSLTTTSSNSSHTNNPKKDEGSSSLKKEYALKLGVSEADIKNEKLYQFINEWYAVPYKYAGKDKGGIDCSGFAGVLFSTIYNKRVSSSSKAIAEESKKINSSELQEGDLVFFKIESGSVSHVGVYLQNQKFVHASTKKGVIISDLNEPYYKKYFYGAGRVK